MTGALARPACAQPGGRIGKTGGQDRVSRGGYYDFP